MKSNVSNMDAPQVMSALVKAANEVGIDVELALRFMYAFSMQVASNGPTKQVKPDASVPRPS